MTSGLTGPRQPFWLRAAPRAAEALFVIVIAWLLAEALWFSLYGTDHRRIAASPEAPRAMDADIRRVDTAGLDDLFAARGRAETAADAPAPESQLNFRLRGVRVDGGDSASVAIIEVPGQGQRLLRVGDEVSPGIVLASVTNTHVIINRRGARESIYLREDARRPSSAAPLDSGPGVRPAPEYESGGAASPEARAPSASAGPSGLTSAPDPAQAARLSADDWVDGLRLEPVLEGGAMTGLRVRANTRLEVLRASGLLPGDIVRSVNGRRLDGAQAAQAVAATFETAGEARLEIERDGAPVVLSIALNQGG
ncbi:type II secretion system protein N [Maricaulaceae bacterium MS644]